MADPPVDAGAGARAPSSRQGPTPVLADLDLLAQLRAGRGSIVAGLAASADRAGLDASLRRLRSSPATARLRRWNRAAVEVLLEAGLTRPAQALVGCSRIVRVLASGRLQVFRCHRHRLCLHALRAHWAALGERDRLACGVRPAFLIEGDPLAAAPRWDSRLLRRAWGGRQIQVGRRSRLIVVPGSDAGRTLVLRGFRRLDRIADVHQTVARELERLGPAGLAAEFVARPAGRFCEAWGGLRRGRTLVDRPAGRADRVLCLVRLTG